MFYSSLHPKVLSKLPPYLRDLLPYVITPRAAVHRSLVDTLARDVLGQASFEDFSKRINELHYNNFYRKFRSFLSLVHDRPRYQPPKPPLEKGQQPITHHLKPVAPTTNTASCTAVCSTGASTSSAAAGPAPPPPNPDQAGTLFKQFFYTPSAKYWRDLFVECSELKQQREVYMRQMDSLGGKYLCGDTCYKPDSQVFVKTDDGSVRAAAGCYTVMNEHVQILGWWHKNSKMDMKELEEPLKALARRLEIIGVKVGGIASCCHGTVQYSLWMAMLTLIDICSSL